MRLAVELEEMAKGVAEVNQRVAEYPDELQPFMSQLLIQRMMILSRREQGTADWKHRSYEDLFLSVGPPRQAPFFVPDEPVLISAELQNCYLNCYNAVCELEGYTYVEGYAQTNLLLVQHAWLEDPDGNVVDPTWALLDEHKWNVTPTYCGVRFDTEFVLRNANETGWCSMFNREWEQSPDFPSLRHGFIFEDGLAIDYDRKVQES